MAAELGSLLCLKKIYFIMKAIRQTCCFNKEHFVLKKIAFSHLKLFNTMAGMVESK